MTNPSPLLGPAPDREVPFFADLGGDPGGGGDPWAIVDAIMALDDEAYAASQMRRITVSVNYRGVAISLDMFIKNDDFDPNDPAQRELVGIAAEAAYDAGAPSFTVTSGTCCHDFQLGDSHNVGEAI